MKVWVNFLKECFSFDLCFSFPFRIIGVNHKSQAVFPEAVARRCSKVFLEILQHSQENTCARVSQTCNFIKKETLTQALSCEFCEISNNTFSYWTPPVAASTCRKTKKSKWSNICGGTTGDNSELFGNRWKLQGLQYQFRIARFFISNALFSASVLLNFFMNWASNLA